MAGLMNKDRKGQQSEGDMQGQSGAPPRGGQQGQSQTMEEESNVSPEEQAQYNEFVSQGRMLVDDKKTMPTLLKNIQGDGNPVEGLANSLYAVVMRLEDSAEKAGKEFSGDVKYHGATEIMEHMVELAEAAGIHEYSDQNMESALTIALDLYRVAKQQSGEIQPEQFQDELAMLQQAEQEGRLDEVLPGITEYAENAPQPQDVEGSGQPPAEEERPRRGLMRG